MASGRLGKTIPKSLALINDQSLYKDEGSSLYTYIMFPNCNNFVFRDAYPAGPFNVSNRDIAHDFSCYITDCTIPNRHVRKSI